MVGQEYAITQASVVATQFFARADAQTPELFSKFTNLEALHDTVRAELTSAKPIEPVPLFGFSMAGFAVANADHSDSFSPQAGGNSGRGPRTV